MDGYLVWPCHCRAWLPLLVLPCLPSFWTRPSSVLPSNSSGTSEDQLAVTSVFPLSSQQQKLLHCPRQLEKLLLSLLHATPRRTATPLRLGTTSMSKYLRNLSEGHRSQEMTPVPNNVVTGRKNLQRNYYWLSTNRMPFVSLLSKMPQSWPGALLKLPLASLCPYVLALAARL